ncbi:TraB/TrbI/VirB10 family type IV secretion system protein [Cetobacterium sp.]|uniref:TrbI/VirB10 family protein n=1 Tax=Cetobacterium sp. TaxID=2071632 RepID=UPI002FC6176D
MRSLNEFVKKLIPENSSLNHKNIFISIVIVLGIIGLTVFGVVKKNDKPIDLTSDMSAERTTDTSATVKTLVGTKQDEEILTLDDVDNTVLKTKKDLQDEAKRQQEDDFYYEDPIVEEPIQLSRKEERKLQRGQSQMVLVRINDGNSNQTNSNKPNTDFLIPPLPGFPEPDENFQKKKAEFLKESAMDNFVLEKPLTPALSPYEVKAGTIVPLTLETQINSDLPGDITAIVQMDIYDSKTGRILLIPSGSRVIGKYNSNVSFGQERVQVVFNRITLPNQKSINIGAMIGVDQMGQTGVKDKVDTKLGKVFSSVVMSAILGAGTAVVTEENTDKNWQNEAGRGAGEQILNVGTTYTNKLLNVQPTLEIRAGYTIGLFVSKDLLLEPYKGR